MGQTKSRQLSHLFKHYPYKKRHKKNIFRPLTKTWTYNPDHELSLNWSQWQIFMHIYFKHLLNFLLSGQPILLPHNVGMFRMYKHKYKKKKSIDYNHYNKTGEKIMFQNNHTNGYGPLVQWHRRRYQGDFRRKWHWMIRLINTTNQRLAKEYKKDPTLLFSYNDVTSN